MGFNVREHICVPKIITSYRFFSAILDISDILESIFRSVNEPELKTFQVSLALSRKHK
jgi:hypothetical protein